MAPSKRRALGPPPPPPLAPRPIPCFPCLRLQIRKGGEKVVCVGSPAGRAKRCVDCIRRKAKCDDSKSRFPSSFLYTLVNLCIVPPHAVEIARKIQRAARIGITDATIGLYKKYVAEGSRYRVELKTETIAEIELRIKTHGNDAEQHRTIFNTAKNEVVATLDPIFIQGFVSTPAWEKFLAGNRIPADYEL